MNSVAGFRRDDHPTNVAAMTFSLLKFVIRYLEIQSSRLTTEQTAISLLRLGSDKQIKDEGKSLL